jgi:AraC-like DNA-binding protein
MIGAPEDMMETPNGGLIMDALSDVLRVAQLSGGVFLHAEFTAPWCVATRVTSQLCAPFLGPTAHLVPYHYVLEGEFRVALEGGESQALRSGDVVLFPRNDTHILGSDLGLPAVLGGDLIRPPDAGEGLYSIRHGGGGARARIICGFLGSDGANGNPVLATLPPVIRLKTEETGSAEWIRSTFQYAADEVARGRPGSETVLAKLSELLFVEAVRRYLEDLPADQTGWLAGLRDPVVARVLALMHGDIARPWSVDELGRQVGSSRSVLAERFGRFIGTAPMQYLAHWRLQVAAQKLKSTSASLAQVAEAIGYESEAAFSRAFKKKFGSAPATWRRS